MFPKKTVRDIDLDGKKVLLRVDFNLPLVNGTVTDETRVREALPTIRYLVEHNARTIVVSHLGRPQGEGYEHSCSNAPAVRVLERLIGKHVELINDICGEKAHEAVEALAPGEILMLENIRFDKREKKNDDEFAHDLASLADIYVNDAFGAAHRAHASIVGVARYLPAVSGLLFEREVDSLTSMLDDPARPFVAVLGGSKVSDKIAVIENLLDKVDTLIVGGGMCFTFLRAKGYETGKSLTEEDWIERAGGLIDMAKEKGVKLLLPVDMVVASSFAEDADTKIVRVEEMPEDMMGLDIGPDTCEIYNQAIAQAKTVFWNGPMGVFEMKAFENGTKQVALAIAKNKAADTVVGGGDSVAAVKQFDLRDQFTFISTGGGASMELLKGKELPGMSVLLDI